MKKSFSLIEVIIATILLSTIVLSLFQIKENNIAIVNKNSEIQKNLEYILLALNTNVLKEESQSIYLDKLIDIKEDSLRKKLKDKKVNIETKLIDVKYLKKEDFNLKVSQFITKYNLNGSMTKNIYRFKLEIWKKRLHY